MSDLLLGLGVVFLDFYMGFGDYNVGLIPDVAGYIFLLSAFRKIRGKTPIFDLGEKLARAMVLVSAFTYLADLLALLKDFQTMKWMFGLLNTVGGIGVSFFIVRGLRDVETGAGKDFQVRQLMSMWLATATLQCFTYFVNLVPLLGLVCTFASYIVMVVFLVAFHRTEKLAKPFLYA